MKEYTLKIIELKKRIYYLNPLETSISKDLFSQIREKDLTILMTPLSTFDEVNIDLPNDKYHNLIIKYLKEGNNPCIIITSHLERLILETMKGHPKQPRIFMQAGNEIYSGFTYYLEGEMNMNNNELMQLVENINPKSISVGGAFLAETEKELKKWDLEKFPWESSADSGCYVGPIYLMFRDKYPTRIAENLVKRG